MMGCGFFAIGAILTNSLFQFGTTPRTMAVSVSSTRPHVPRSEDAQRDLVINLPGLTKDPGFDQFAGYLDASDTKHIFYLYMESQSNPETDPVVFWSNGGKFRCTLRRIAHIRVKLCGCKSHCMQALTFTLFLPQDPVARESWDGERKFTMNKMHNCVSHE
jgi:hypothetical protein